MKTFDTADRVLAFGSRYIVHAAIITVVVGIGLTALSTFVGLDDVVFTGVLKDGQEVALAPGIKKQVGYFLALNWSVYGAVVLPFVVAFCLKMRGDMDVALRELAANGMVRDENFNKIGADALLARWKVDRRSYGWILLLVAAVAALFVAGDWWKVAASPLLHGFPAGAPPLTARDYEYDWSLAALMAGEDVSMGVNLAFGILAYLLIAVLGTVLAFVAMIDAVFFVGFAFSLFRSGDAAGSDGAPLPRTWRLTAMPADPDDRLCGFRAFSPVFSSMFCAAVAILLGLHLMIVQNAYLRAPASSDIGSYLADDWNAAFGLTAEAIKKVDPASLFTGLFIDGGGDFVVNVQSIVGALVMLFVIGICLCACWTLLLKSAESAKDWALEHRSALSGELGVSEDEIRGRLRAMKFWPMGWLSLTTAILIMIVLFGSVFYYRLLLLPIAGGAALVVVRLAAAFTRAVGRARDDS
jgi:hypothetical protein